MSAPSKSEPAETVAIVGVGLIGGSLAAALQRQGASAPNIIGVGRNAQRLEAALRAGLISRGTTDITAAAADATLIVFCTPVDLIAAGVRSAAPHCKPGTLITDAGSVKGAICEPLSGRLNDGVEFIGSHPLAGSDLGGFEHADPRLFDGKVCVVTPDSATSAAGLERLTRFWQSLSMRVVRMSPAEHDRALAQTSHLPHVVACALVNALEEVNAPLTASGFRDTTRIAGGDPNIWVPILLENSAEIARSLDAFGERLAEFRRAVAARDAESLRTLLERAKSRRERLDPAAD